MNFKVKFLLINLFFISGCTVHACGSNDDKPQPAVETSPSNCDCNYCDQPAAE